MNAIRRLLAPFRGPYGTRPRDRPPDVTAHSRATCPGIGPARGLVPAQKAVVVSGARGEAVVQPRCNLAASNPFPVGTASLYRPCWKGSVGHFSSFCHGASRLVHSRRPDRRFRPGVVVRDRPVITSGDRGARFAGACPAGRSRRTGVRRRGPARSDVRWVCHRARRPAGRTAGARSGSAEQRRAQSLGMQVCPPAPGPSGTAQLDQHRSTRRAPPAQLDKHQARPAPSSTSTKPGPRRGVSPGRVSAATSRWRRRGPDRHRRADRERFARHRCRPADSATWLSGSVRVPYSVQEGPRCPCRMES